MRIIKRYSNRRFYDTKYKKMIHLEDIANYLKNGEDLRIIDTSKSNEDITDKVLAQTFLKLATKNKNKDFIIFLFSSLIREIQSNLPKFLYRLMQGGIGTELLTTEKLIKIIQTFIDIGELNIYEQNEYIKKLFSNLSSNQEQIKKLLLNRLKENQGILKAFDGKIESKSEKEINLTDYLKKEI